MLFYPGGNYTLLTTFLCSSLLFIKRRDSEIVVKGYKTSAVGFWTCLDEMGVLRRPTGSTCLEIPRFPQLCIKEEEWRWFWGGHGHRWNNTPLSFISLVKLPHFCLRRRTLVYPFPLPWTLCFALHPHVLYSRDTSMLAQVLAEGGLRPELGRRDDQH